MASAEMKTCMLCEYKVCKLLRHIKLVHPEATPELIAELVTSQRKKRSDSISSNPIEYRLCKQHKENGDICNAIIKKQGFVSNIDILIIISNIFGALNLGTESLN